MGNAGGMDLARATVQGRLFARPGCARAGAKGPRGRGAKVATLPPSTARTGQVILFTHPLIPIGPNARGAHLVRAVEGGMGARRDSRTSDVRSDFRFRLGNPPRRPRGAGRAQTARPFFSNSKPSNAGFNECIVRAEMRSDAAGALPLRGEGSPLKVRRHRPGRWLRAPIAGLDSANAPSRAAARGSGLFFATR